MTFSQTAIRAIEILRGEVTPSTGGGNPQTGEVWSEYRDGTTLRSDVWSQVPGTVNRYETYQNAVNGWRNLDDEQKEELQAEIDRSVRDEDRINLQHAQRLARAMYLAGVNSPARFKKLQEATT